MPETSFEEVAYGDDYVWTALVEGYRAYGPTPEDAERNARKRKEDASKGGGQ